MNLKTLIALLLKLVVMRMIGKTNPAIIFPMKLTNNSKMGCVKLADVMAPVVIMSVIKIGNKLLVKPTKFCITSFTISRLLEKFSNTTLIINIISTK